MQLLIKEMYESVNSIKLSKNDQKLLQLLIQNSITPITQLAKKIGISKSAVSRRMDYFEKNLLILGPALYYKINSNLNNPLYWCDIITDFGIKQKEESENLLKIEGVNSVFWLNGTYNLLLGISSQDPQVTIDEIIKKIKVNRIRYRKVINNWFNPPYIFPEVPDVPRKGNINTINFKLSDYEIRLIRELEKSPRTSIVALSSKLKSSASTIIKKIAELKKNGFIISFTTHINYWTVGLEVVSISIQVKGRENISKAVSLLLSQPQTSNIWEMEDENNLGFVLWVRKNTEVTKIIKELERICPNLENVDISIITGLKGK